MKNRDIVVSISCITYNHAPYIRQCLDGFMMQQTDFAFEILIHDDASTDGTAEIIKEYEAKYPDIIKPIYEEENQWMKGRRGSAVFNFPRAKGKYIAMCEGDDYWTDPLKLQKQVDIMESDPDCHIVFAKIQPVSVNGVPQNWTIPLNNIVNGKIDLWDYTREEYYNCNWTFHTSSFLFKTSVLNSYIKSGFVEVFPYGDMPLLLYNLINGYGYYINEVIGCYRVLSGGYNSQIAANPLFSIRQDKQLIIALRFLDKYTNYVYHINIRRKIKVLQYSIDKRQLGKVIYLYPKYWFMAMKIIINKIIKLFH